VSQKTKHHYVCDNCGFSYQNISICANLQGVVIKNIPQNKKKSIQHVVIGKIHFAKQVSNIWDRNIYAFWRNHGF